MIGGSGDRKGEFTAETRSRGEEQCQIFTTETRRHGEESGDRVIARDRVIGKAAYICHPERVGANATASRRTPTAPIPEYAVSGSSYETFKDLLPRLTSAIQTLRAVIREIFDESAYDRFLLQTHASRSVASYRAFTRERDAALVKKPRCC
jgi:hypothetical protein